MAEWTLNEKKRVQIERNDPNEPKVSLPRKPKDLKCPKRAPTAYFLFAASVRQKLSEENPDKKTTEIAELIGARWKEVSDAKKEAFSEEAAKLREQYKLKLEEYKGSEDEKAFNLQIEEWQKECHRRRQKAVESMEKKKKKRVHESSSHDSSSSDSGSDSDSGSSSSADSSSGSDDSDSDSDSD